MSMTANIHRAKLAKVIKWFDDSHRDREAYISVKLEDSSGNDVVAFFDVEGFHAFVAWLKVAQVREPTSAVNAIDESAILFDVADVTPPLDSDAKDDAKRQAEA